MLPPYGSTVRRNADARIAFMLPNRTADGQCIRSRYKRGLAHCCDLSIRCSSHAVADMRTETVVGIHSHRTSAT